MLRLRLTHTYADRRTVHTSFYIKIKHAEGLGVENACAEKQHRVDELSAQRPVYTASAWSAGF